MQFGRSIVKFNILLLLISVPVLFQLLSLPMFDVIVLRAYIQLFLHLITI